MDDAGTQFEDRLLAELMPLVGTVPARPVASPRLREQRRRLPGRTALGRLLPVGLPVPPHRAVALIGLVLIMVVGVAVGVAVWPRRLATPAYAVEEGPDGTVIVTVDELSDPAGLERALTEHHVHAVVLAVDPAAPCADRVLNVPAPGALQGRPDHPNMLVIKPALLPRSGTVLLGLLDPDHRNGGGQGGARPATTGPGQAHRPVTVFFTVIQGPAPRCFPGVVPAQPVPTS